MTEGATVSPSQGAGAHPPARSSRTGWFRTREGRRYGWELALVIVMKLVLLGVLWFVIVEASPKSASPPATVVRHLYTSAAPAVRHD